MPNKSTNQPTPSSTGTDDDRAGSLRSALVDRLRADGAIKSPAVEAAFRTVAREQFLPAGVPLRTVYAVGNPMVPVHDQHREAIDVVAAAHSQARMLEQAQLRPGMTVLEVGSGGLNAALIAEVVGPTGHVVSVDIHPRVVELAETLLAGAGYHERVTVLAADAGRGVPGHGPFEAIIVTVAAWDIAPAWLQQLAPGGTLVLPLIMNGAIRTIGFRREGDHLRSTSTEATGFAPMRGVAQHLERLVSLPGPNGSNVTLRFDSDVPNDVKNLDGVLSATRTHLWSGVTIPPQTSLADLHLWLAWYLPGFCRLTAADGTELAAERDSWFPLGTVCGSALAYLALRPAPDGVGHELGAGAYGFDGDLAAATLVEQIQAWDHEGRHTTPTFEYWPMETERPGIPAGTPVLDKTHGIVAIYWPAPS